MERRKPSESPLFQQLLGLGLALLLVIVVTSVLIALSGKSPLAAFQAMIKGAFGTKNSTAETMIKTVPLLLAALGLTICYRTGLTSLGSEGQIVIGGLMATIVGIYMGGLPKPILVPLAMIAGMIGGGLWASIAGFLKAKLGVSEIINTIMLNYVATYFVSYLISSGPLQEESGFYPQSDLLSQNAWLSSILPGTRMHTGVIVAAVSVVAVYLLLWKLPLGYQMRAVGNNPIAARTNGIKVARNMVLAMVLSGVFAGLAGAIELMGIHHRLMNGFSSSYGFDAMAVALLGGLHPAGVTVAALFFGALRTGANTMQRTLQVPVSLVNVIQGLVILFVLMQAVLRSFTIKLFTSKKGAAAKEA
ncbi:ABC transporter permease [Pseudoflavonifractor sp. 524-17]|uniref:ABC transporter permease subunit n=1 Tax=Pseudoflavonifractor sp. 524-17 TaxID=2304577 RepID=UPI001379CC0E